MKKAAWQLPGLPLTGAVALVIVGSFVALESIQVSTPGLQYDETLFVNAAVGMGGNHFIERRFLGVPLLLMAYIGALKAYVFMPIFAVFGVSAATIRLPVILLTGLALWLSYRLARKLVGPWPAVLLLLLVATEPALLFTSKDDWGPTVLMTLFKMTALFGLYAFLETGRLRHLWLLYASVLLGTFNKLDFLWFAGGLAVASAALWPEVRLRWSVLRTPRVIILTTVAAVLGVGMLFAFLPNALAEAGLPPVTLGSHFTQLATLYSQTFDGSTLYTWMTDGPLHQTAWTPWVAPVAGAAAVGGALLIVTRLASGEAGRDWRNAIFFAVLFAATFGAMVATRAARGPHHVFMLWALPTFSVACAVRGAWRLVPASLARDMSMAVVVGLAATLAFNQATVDAEYLHAFAGGTLLSSTWTTAIYDLAAELQRDTGGTDAVFSADWGYNNQLLGLAAPRDRWRYQDVWLRCAELNRTSSDDVKAFRADFVGRRVFVVLHTDRFTIFGGNANCAWLISQSGFATRLRATVSDSAGRPVYLVYEVKTTR